MRIVLFTQTIASCIVLPFPSKAISAWIYAEGATKCRIPIAGE
jgi:hypothetical protein